MGTTFILWLHVHLESEVRVKVTDQPAQRHSGKIQILHCGTIPVHFRTWDIAPFYPFQERESGLSEFRTVKNE